MSRGDKFNPQCRQLSSDATNYRFTNMFQTLLLGLCSISPPGQWPRDFGETLSYQHIGSYDFVVVGGGSAASVVASRLSENPHWKVLVLEFGNNPPIESEIPSKSFTMHNTSYTWNYYTERDNQSCLGYKNEVCYWPRGKMIGGTGAIDLMLHILGNREDYDNWERKGNPTWGWNEVSATFDKSISLGKSNVSDGRAGLKVNSIPVTHSAIKEMLLEAPAELGVPRTNGFSEGADIGYTCVPGTYENGRRSSTGKSYLGEGKNRLNLHVIKNALVTKIDFDSTGQKVVGATFTYLNKHVIKVHVTKEVVVSAGAVGSPQLLMLSGIGPREHLESLGIPVVQDLSVGNNLQNQMILPVFLRIKQNILKSKTPFEELDVTYRYLVNRTGDLAGNGVAPVVGLINSKPQSCSPYPDVGVFHLFAQHGTNDLEYYIKAFGFKEHIANSIRAESANEHVLIVLLTILQPKSIGKLRLRSTDPSDPPKIYPNYFEQKEDIDTIMRAINYIMQLEKTQAYMNQGAEIMDIYFPMCKKSTFKCVDYWLCYIHNLATSLYRISGTVKMGPDTDPEAVVDSRLCVKGVKGLRVVDSSVMPNITSANSNLPTIMIAEKAAEFINDYWGRFEPVVDGINVE